MNLVMVQQCQILPAITTGGDDPILQPADAPDLAGHGAAGPP